MKFALCRLAPFLCAVCLFTNSPAAEPAKIIELWPGSVPGEKGDIGEEKDMTRPTDNLVAGKRLIRLNNVSKPIMSIYRPAAYQDTGAAVLVCPGGAYQILALDLEGTEICDWLNSIGVTGVLLKYRVPKRAGLEKHAAALQDAQPAMSLLRQRAKEWNIDPQRIGVLGFSAGGHLAAMLSTSPERSYPLVDGADRTDVRPNFTVHLYPQSAGRVAPLSDGRARVRFAQNARDGHDLARPRRRLAAQPRVAGEKVSGVRFSAARRTRTPPRRLRATAVQPDCN